MGILCAGCIISYHRDDVIKEGQDGTHIIKFRLKTTEEKQKEREKLKKLQIGQSQISRHQYIESLEYEMGKPLYTGKVKDILVLYYYSKKYDIYFRVQCSKINQEFIAKFKW